MMKPSASLAAYIETEIIPRYAAFDRAHGIDHVRTVIAQSLDLARHYPVDPDMVYTVAAYHDTGLVAGRERHHLVSGELLAADAHLRRWFSEAQRTSGAASNTSRTNTPSRGIFGSGFPNRAMRANWKSCVR